MKKYLILMLCLLSFEVQLRIDIEDLGNGYGSHA